MEFWTEVRRRVLTGELSKRAACREYELNWHTLAKILAHEETPGGIFLRQRQQSHPLDDAKAPVIGNAAIRAGEHQAAVAEHLITGSDRGDFTFRNLCNKRQPRAAEKS